jgi:hypothetical protein
MLRLAAIFFATGCSPMAIEGEVVDVTGAPIEDALITAMETPCNALTDAEGQFNLVCQPGTYKLVVSVQGYLTKTEIYEATERKRYKAGKFVLVKIPNGKGLFMFSGNEYIPMKPGRLERKLEADGVKRKRAYCIERAGSEPNVIKAGAVPFFDNETAGWRPFRLDDEGCAYRDSRNASGKWEVVYREKPPYEEKRLSERKKIARIQFTPGEYFIADWKGFFVVDPKQKHRYTGHWIKTVP